MPLFAVDVYVFLMYSWLY